MRMHDHLKRSRAGALRAADEGVAGPDCIIEQERADYDPRAREEFVAWFTQWLQRNPTQKTTEPLLPLAWEDDELPDTGMANRVGGNALPSSQVIPALRLTQPRRSPPQT